MRSSTFFGRKSALVLLFLLVAASVLSIASYEYSDQVSAGVGDLSLGEIHTTAQIEASDLSAVLAKGLMSVSANLDVMASSAAVSTHSISAAVPLFNAAQNSTESLTRAYFWVDKDGLLLLSSNGTSVVYAPGTGRNLSAEAFFTTPEETQETFFSSATPSLTNASVEYVFISRPVFSAQNASGSPSKAFAGVVGVAIDLRALGRSLQSDLSPKFQAAVGVLDIKGTILYSGNESAIGEDVFGSPFQSALPADLRPEFDRFLNESLSGQAGFQDLSYRGVSATLAYQPVIVNSTTPSGGHARSQWGVLYVTGVDSLAASATGLIDQGQLVGLIMILGIAGVSGGVALTMLRWNRRLDAAVQDKTSDLLKANETLAAKAKAEKELMNITAHELRTPTQSILANTELLRRAIRPALGIAEPPQTDHTGEPLPGYGSLDLDIQPGEIVEMVESSFRNAQRLQKLTQNILEVTRIDNMTYQLEKEVFELNEVVKENIEDARISLIREQEGHPNIAFEARQPLLWVEADRTKVGEVLGNLLDNALRYSADGGRITVTTDKNDDGFAVVKVEDEGSGIDPAMMPRLFGKFATKTGTGLGLYISKAYVEAHGGTISAQNNDDGNGQGKRSGATFIFTVPLADRHPGGGGPAVGDGDSPIGRGE